MRHRKWLIAGGAAAVLIAPASAVAQTATGLPAPASAAAIAGQPAPAGSPADIAAVAAAAAVAAVTTATPPTPARFDQPSYLSLAQDVDTVYAPPTPPREDEGVNLGGVNIDLAVRDRSDYVYRGVDRSEAGGHEDAPNLQFDGRLEFNLGKLPHPFVGLFANVFDSDPVSRFQEIRPVFGADWTLRPFTFEVGHNTFIYPERDESETSEVYAKVTLDDSFIWHTERPVLTPYVFAAYDYDQNEGWYMEAGIKHDFVLEDYGITITAVADIAAVQNHGKQFVFTSTQDSGFHHYDLGLIGSYSLNRLFNFSKRYGEFTLEGYLFYTDGLNQDIRYFAPGASKPIVESQIWGGAGIGFKY